MKKIISVLSLSVLIITPSLFSVDKNLLKNPEKFYINNYHHFQNLRYNTLQVDTPNNCLDLALEWAKLALDNLVVDHPDLGQGLVAGLGASGRSSSPREES